MELHCITKPTNEPDRLEASFFTPRRWSFHSSWHFIRGTAAVLSRGP